MHRRTTACTLAFGLCALLCLSACEEAVNPILESDRNFTLFGTLDMQEDTQFVRVIPIREVLDPGSPAPLDVRFTSTDLTTGERIVWRDSIITFDDGSFGHVFYTPLRLRAGHRYRIEVTPGGSDVVTSVETTVPPVAEATVFPESVSGGVGLPQGSQRIHWDGIGRDPFLVELWYRFLVSETGPFRDVLLPYEPDNVAAAGGWDVTLNLRKDRLTLDTLVAVPTLPLAGVGLRLTMLDDQFIPPGGVFDPEILVQPGTFSNVQNGFGFVGSVSRFSVEWLFATDTVRRLNYLALEDFFGPNVRATLARLYDDFPLPHAYPGDHSGLQRSTGDRPGHR